MEMLAVKVERAEGLVTARADDEVGIGSDYDQAFSRLGTKLRRKHGETFFLYDGDDAPPPREIERIGAYVAKMRTRTERRLRAVQWLIGDRGLHFAIRHSITRRVLFIGTMLGRGAERIR